MFFKFILQILISKKMFSMGSLKNKAKRKINQRAQRQKCPQSYCTGKGKGYHSSILAWRIPWIEEPGQLQSMGLQRAGHEWTTNIVLLPRELLLPSWLVCFFSPSFLPNLPPSFLLPLYSLSCYLCLYTYLNDTTKFSFYTLAICFQSSLLDHPECLSDSRY